MTKTLIEERLEDPKHMRLYQQERAIYEVTELLESLLRDMGVSRTELARRLGKTKGWVTQLLDTDANKTIRTVADACAVLGCEFRSFAQPIRVSNITPLSASSPPDMAPVSGRVVLRVFQGGHPVRK